MEIFFKKSIIKILTNPIKKLKEIKRVTIYKEEQEAFNATFNKYNPGTPLNSVIFIGYTSSMGITNLVRYLQKHHIIIKKLQFLIKHPESISENIIFNDRVFPRFPDNSKQIKTRKSEIEGLIGNLQLQTENKLIVEYEVKGYYSIPSIRAVIINKEYGYLSIYGPYYAGNYSTADVSGTTAWYVRLSKQSSFERQLLESILDWFNSEWRYGIPLKI